MNALLDHLWQSLACMVLLGGLGALTTRHSAQVRLWLWRLAAAKWLVPFSVLGAIGGWWGFPPKFPGDPPPEVMVRLVDAGATWFSVSAWLPGMAARVVVLGLLLLAAAACVRWSFWKIHRESLRARVEELRLEADPDDREPSLGFLRAALFTACASMVITLPLLGGAVRASTHAHQVLEANTRAMQEARVTLRPAKSGLGSRYFVDVDARGVTIRNITVRELTAMAYGVNRFFVRGKHFRDGDDEDWLVDSRHDVRIESAVIEPDRFDTYALRNVITRELATNFGLEIYVNSECQKPCGKWGDKVLLEVAPDSWALVDSKQVTPGATTTAPPRGRQ